MNGKRNEILLKRNFLNTDLLRKGQKKSPIMTNDVKFASTSVYLINDKVQY